MQNKLYLSRNRLITLLILLFTLESFDAKSQEFAISNLSDSIKLNANAIVRKFETNYTISSIKKVEYSVGFKIGF